MPAEAHGRLRPESVTVTVAEVRWNHKRRAYRLDMKNTLVWTLITPVVLAFAAALICELTGKRIDKGVYVLAVLLFGPYIAVPIIAHLSVPKFMAIGILVMLFAAFAGTWVAKALKWISRIKAQHR